MCKHYVIRDSNLPRKLFTAVHMYIQRKLRLPDGQVRKLARAAGKGEGLKLRLSAVQLAAGTAGAGGIPVSLTAMQDKRVSAASSGKGVNLEFSPTQIASMKREGGFLGALLPLLARIAPALLKPLGIGALTGAAGFGAQGLLRKMTGHGLRLGPPPSTGRGLKKKPAEQSQH